MADVGDKNGVAETSMRPRGCGPVTGVVDWLMSFATVRGFFALYRKNALVAVRNHRATLLRLIAPLLFLLLALLIDKAIQANDAGQETFQDVMDPTAELIAPIPSCNEDMYIGPSNCSELMYSPNNYITQAIMGNVTSRNAVPITAAAYPSQDSVQDYLLAHPDEVIGAVHFVFEDPSNPSVLNGFIVQTNTTVKFFKGTYQDPNTFVQLPLQSAVQREITRYYMSETPSLAGMAEDLVWNVSIKTFAHPAIATTSVLGQVLGPFVFAACMFSFVSQIGFMVAEKEQGLRQALQSMGCTTAAYWLSWAAWEFTIAFFSANLIACFGLLLHFDLFLNNNYGLLFFLFFLFLLALSSLGMFVCTLISKQQVAVYVGFAIFLIGWIMQTVVIFGVPYSVDFYYDYNMALTCIFSLFPWDLLAKGFGDLGSATVTSTSPGISWSQRYSYCQDIPLSQDQPPFDPKEQYIDYECVMPLGTIYVVLTVLWLGYFVLAVYFDQIIPNAMGVKLPLWFPFMPSYWMPSLAKARGLHSIDDGMGPDDRPDEQDGDVAEEEVRMRELLQHRTGAASDAAEMSAAGANLKNRNAVEVFGLKRVFPYIPCSGSCGSFCFAFARTKDERAFWAIKNSWLGIPEGQLFCLLGPNGAGKSTTINVLTGVLPASDGEALVYGEPISAAGSMERIRSMMGVCPQFDVLWGELTGVEHLQIYGAVKGVDWRRVGGEADELLEKVKLTYAARQQTAAYSGGMRRRLSVAIALLGNPKIVYLDEPTTGMDPISRRYVWDIIQEAKVGRAIVLTTHSMEEADILGDRIAIMAKGRLRCIGSSLRLKQKFGSGYQVAVSVTAPATDYKDLSTAAVETKENSARFAKVKEYFRERLDGIAPSEETRAYINFLVPREKEDQLMPFLKQLEKDSDELHITDVQLSLTSLEEVFLNIAKAAEIEEARRRGSKPVEVHLPSGTTMQVPLGAELAEDPATGAQYTVRWGTDEAGNLCVLDCKPVDGSGTSLHGAAVTRDWPSVTGGLGTIQAAPPVPSYVDVKLDNGTLLRVGAGQEYVLNPVTNQPYRLTWGEGPDGEPAVVHFEAYYPGSVAEPKSSLPTVGLMPGVPASISLQRSGSPLPGAVSGASDDESQPRARGVGPRQGSRQGQGSNDASPRSRG